MHHLREDEFVACVFSGLMVNALCAEEAAKLVVGQAVGHDTKSTLIGAGVGAVAGHMLGSEGDKKKTEAKRQAEMGSLRQEMNTVTVNITNSNGSVSQVKLRKQGVGYVGPKGEFYDHLPSEDELKPVYGF